MIIEVFLILLTVYFLSLFWKKKQNLPPGPWSFPYIGRAQFKTVEECQESRSKYGNLIMVRTGIANFLYICDYKVAKEALSKLNFADRPDWKFVCMFNDERRNNKAQGVIFSNGEHWQYNRRFLLRHLRDLGMGKSKIEGIILHEIENLVEDFKSLTKSPSKLPFSINVAILNIIWQLVATSDDPETNEEGLPNWQADDAYLVAEDDEGKRYNFADKQVKIFMDNVNKLQEIFLTLGVPDFFPVLRYIVPKPLLDYFISQKIFDEMCLQYENLVQPLIDEHVKKLDLKNPCDLMDEYLKEMKENSSKGSFHFSYTDLTRITFDLFTAGNDTTGNMTRWTLLYLAKFPNIQRKIQEDIDRIVPVGTLPGLEHRDSLAYLDATINEVQRLSSMIAFGLFRSTASDATLSGYFIPKGTVVLSAAAISHRDPTYWKNPDDFDPTRFLDANGKYIVTCDGFQAFGIGKRQCLGEQFARMELYLMLAALLQNFTFGPPEGEEINVTPLTFSTFHFPRKDQKFVIKLRH